jgi:GTP-binding protein HflX
MNKLDRLPDGEADPGALKRRLLGDSTGDVDARAVAISALSGSGMDELLAAVDDALPVDPVVRAKFRIPAGDGATLAMLHEFGRVLSTKYVEDQCEIEAEAPESLMRRLPAQQ